MSTRKQFLQSLAVLPLAGAAMKLNELNHLTTAFSKTEKMPVLFLGHSTEQMPVLFLGHGSPMNAIEENEFVSGFRKVGREITKPNAILCISAHWETRGTFVTAMQNPPTIHDFGGFPQELLNVQYPAKGSPELANETKALVTKTNIGLDEKWGLDHGAWSVIKHLYPDADVPVIQMSLDHFQTPQYHYELAQELKALREKGVLIIGSGNMVHNLGMIRWDKMQADNFALDWAAEASDKMKQFILNDDHQSLIHYHKQGRAFQLSIPSPEHYLPLLYTLALKEKNEKVSLFNDKAVAGSLTMTSVKIDAA
jgi:4,5-DOPA dioxygenase extradiol